jgi:shikimate 5-dehydrogenase
VAPSLLDGTLSGLSVTAPFKKEAYKLAVNHAARIGENAAACHAANTLVNAGGRLIAENTDVDAFSRILARLCGRDAKTVALVGAGGTARAASVALRRAGMRTIVFNRSEEQGRALAQSFGATFEPLAALGRFDGEIIINALTRGTELQMPLRPGMTYVEAAYGGDGEGPPEGVEFIDGMEILRLQAERQHELFMKVFSDAS